MAESWFMSGRRSLIRTFGRFTALALLAGCGDSESPLGPDGAGDEADAVSEVRIAETVAGLLVRDTVQLTAGVSDQDGQPIADPVVVWSSGDSGILTVSEGGLVTAVSAGETIVTASAEGGSATISLVVDAGFADLAAGLNHTCGLTSAGVAYCWGANGSHQLGAQTDEDCGEFGRCGSRPVRVSGALRFASITAGGAHSCALDPSGQAYCWGDNVWGQLGTGDLSPENTALPLAVAGGQTFTTIRAGREHTCALTGAGELYCWGLDFFGELGRGALEEEVVFPTPAPVVGGLAFADFMGGQFSTCGLTPGGELYCWGSNSFGEVGMGAFSDPDDFPAFPSPTPVAGSLTFSAVGSGVTLGYACAVATGGAAYCWGQGSRGRLGNGSLVNRESPTPVSGGLVFRALTTGAEHACGFAVDGSAWCWGNNSGGQLGVPPTGEQCTDESATLSCSSTPVRMPDGESFPVIAAGGVHTCALDSDGLAYCWGANAVAQLGNGTLGDTSSTPTRIADPT